MGHKTYVDIISYMVSTVRIIVISRSSSNISIISVRIDKVKEDRRRKTSKVRIKTQVLKNLCPFLIYDLSFFKPKNIDMTHAENSTIPSMGLMEQAFPRARAIYFNDFETNF